MTIQRLAGLLLLFVTILSSAVLAKEPPKTYQFAVFSYLGKEATRAEFAPIITYLNEQLTDVKIELQVLSQAEINLGVEQKTIDFVTTNPTHFLVIRQRERLSGPLATWIKKHNDVPHKYLAGTMIIRSDRQDIRTLADIKGKHLAIPGYEFMGGYRAQAYELYLADIHLPQDVGSITEYGGHQQVIDALLQGKVDVGFIRDGIIERLIETGQLDAKRIKVINAQYAPNFPYQVSTRLYPEWPVVALNHVADQAQRQVAAALFSLESHHPLIRDLGIYGFSIPADYLPVEALSRALKLAPFDQEQQVSWYDLWQQHQNWFISLVSIFTLLFISVVLLTIMTRNARKNRAYVSEVLNAQGSLILIHDGTQFIDVSAKFFQYFSDYADLNSFTQAEVRLCHFFVDHPGYIYDDEDMNWIKHVYHSPEQTHKILLDYAGNLWTFRVSVTLAHEIDCYIITLMDISELERMNQAIMEEKQRADHANRSKSEFLATMSHEIRTPMNGIIGLSELGLSEKDPIKTQHYLDRIHHSGTLLLGIINDILDLSKIEAGRLEILTAPFSMTQLVKHIKEMFEQLAEQKDIVFKVNCNPQLEASYLGDELRLRQVLINLISNAIKFTESGQVTLSIDPCHLCHSNDSHKLWLMLRVQDTGMGLSPEQQGRLFKAFTQAETSISRSHGGTGLGLVISQRLVKAMGSIEGIKIDSTPGIGSLFYVSVPLERTTPEQKQQLVKTAKQSLQTAPQKLQGHILLVEDNVINQEVATEQLKQLGLRITLAHNGQEAVNLVSSQTFDLVLMDLQMPVMDGYEATTRIRQQQHALPIIALTAAALNEEEEKVKHSGMNGYLLKPIDIKALLTTLKIWLPSAELSHAETDAPPSLPMIILCDQNPERLRYWANALKTQAKIHVSNRLEKAISLLEQAQPQGHLLIHADLICTPDATQEIAQHRVTIYGDPQQHIICQQVRYDAFIHDPSEWKA